MPNSTSTKIEDSVDSFLDGAPITLPERPRILIVKMWAIGDILMATTLLPALHRRYPGCRITWFVDKRYAAVLEGNPLIDDVIAFDARLWQKRQRYGHVVSYLRMSLAMRRDLRARKFDAVINLTAEKWWSVWFGAAPIRIGLFPRPNPGYMDRLYTRAVPRPSVSPLHSSVHYLMALRPLGIRSDSERMSIGESADAADHIRKRLEADKVDQTRPLIVLVPRATEENRCLADTFCRALIAELKSRYQATTVLSGVPSDKPILAGIAAECGDDGVLVMTDTTLQEYVALLHRADLVITTDTSALHIAGALGIKYIVLFGPAIPAERVPLVGEGVALDNPLVDPPCRTTGCTPAVCRQCVKAFRVEDIVPAVDRLLQ